VNLVELSVMGTALSSCHAMRQDGRTSEVANASMSHARQLRGDHRPICRTFSANSIPLMLRALDTMWPRRRAVHMGQTSASAVAQGHR
jgi:hypothetical protein